MLVSSIPVFLGNIIDLDTRRKPSFSPLVGIKLSRQKALLSSLFRHANDPLQYLHYTIGLA